MPLTQDNIYMLCKTIPKGKVTTYKAICDHFGSKAYRFVGTCMKNNPYAPIVPCHRVVQSDGRIGGFKGHMTGPMIQEKTALLKQEGIIIEHGKIKDFDGKLYRF